MIRICRPLDQYDSKERLLHIWQPCQTDQTDQTDRLDLGDVGNRADYDMGALG